MAEHGRGAAAVVVGVGAREGLGAALARDFGPQGIHVAHFVIDGVIDGDQVNARMPHLKLELGEDGMLSPAAIAPAYLDAHRQHRSAWAHEIDLRPWRETF